MGNWLEKGKGWGSFIIDKYDIIIYKEETRILNRMVNSFSTLLKSKIL